MLNTEYWNDIKSIIPPCNMIVKVRLTNGCEKFDFINEPIDKDMPFQHYLVKEWRYATRDELNDLLHVD